VQKLHEKCILTKLKVEKLREKIHIRHVKPRLAKSDGIRRFFSQSRRQSWFHMPYIDKNYVLTTIHAKNSHVGHFWCKKHTKIPPENSLKNSTKNHTLKNYTQKKTHTKLLTL
jgi:hypothetical protein